MVERDIPESALHGETESLYRAFRWPGTGLIADAAEISPGGAGNALAQRC